MTLEQRAKNANRIVRAGCDMTKCSPMEWNENARIDLREQCQCIRRRGMTPAKEIFFPARGEANWQQCHVDLAWAYGVSERHCIRSDGGVAGEQYGMNSVVDQIHLRVATPSIDTVSRTYMACTCSRDRYATKLHPLSWFYRTRFDKTLLS